MGRFSKERILRRLRRRHTNQDNKGNKPFEQAGIILLGVVILLVTVIFVLALFSSNLYR